VPDWKGGKRGTFFSVAAPPDVTVVLPTRDRLDALGRALGSALAQAEVSLEVIVVDDASVADVAPVVAPLEDERVTTVRLPRNEGVAVARNRGIELARAPWVAFLDDDDLWAPEKLRCQLEAISDGCALSYTGSVYVDERGRPLYERRTPSPAELRPGLLRTNLIGGPSTVLARTETLRAAGGFDTRLSALADWDLWIRLVAEGEAVSVDRVLAGYTVHASNMHIGSRRALARELRYLREKHRALATSWQTEVGAPEFSAWLAGRYRASGRRTAAAREYASLAVRRRRPRHVVQASAAVLGIPPRERRRPRPDAYAWLAPLDQGADST